MLSVPHIRRSRAAALASLALAAAVLIPIGGVATAATASTTCPTIEGTSSCTLVISGPESVQTGVPFTVQVLVTTDGSTVAKGDPCASTIAVNLQLTGAYSNSQTVSAAQGIATFTFTIPGGNAYDGSYNLFASVGGVDLAAAPSTANCGSYFYQSDSQDIMAVTIPDGQPIAPCPDNVVCTQTTNTSTGGGSAATLISDTGQFTGVSWAPQDAALAACGTPADTSSNPELKFDNVAATTPKTIVFALAAKYVTKGIGLFNVCWNGYDANGNPVVGVLPTCGKNATGPCVLFKKSNQQNVGFFGVLAPPGLFDPSGYPR